MSKLTVDQKSIRELLSDKRADFLIPDYQRPYAWGEDECATLWDDLREFAIPGGNSRAFDDDADEYFLGPIVTFKNGDGKLEIIDGQQRLTTLMLLLRAFYDRFGKMKNPDAVELHDMIARCVWRTTVIGHVDTERLKIDSEVASDSDKEEFLLILKNGEVDPKWQSAYAKNFRYFQKAIEEFIFDYAPDVAIFAARILNNVILLPIEAESQDTALRIFSTLNDRGLPLSDADIFKSQFYKFFSDMGRKDEFIRRWKQLEETSSKIFSPQHGTPMDELFTRYMYYERALEGNRNTTTQGLRDYFGRGGYALLRREKTLENLEALAGFWRHVDAREGFSEDVLRQLFILRYAPNGMWTYLASVWFLAKRDEDDMLDDEEFLAFLRRITGFIYAYAVERPGVNALRSPVYPELINIVNGREVTFSEYRFGSGDIRSRLLSYTFTNQRPITRSMLVWRAFSDPDQPLVNPDTVFEVEHIYARRRNEVFPLKRRENLEALGNKAMLEKSVNISASDFRFEDKKKYYLGYRNDKGQLRRGTEIRELAEMARSREDFTEADIEARTTEIINSFVDYLGEVGLLTD